MTDHCDHHEHDHEHGQVDEYGLLMPFVVVTSKGGPFEDTAYAAGWEAGSIDTFLNHAEFPSGMRFRYPVAVRTTNQEQIDLIAMGHELIASFDDSDVEGWSWLILEKP